MLQDCKLSLALVYAKLDDMNSLDKAEDLFNEMIEENTKQHKSRTNEKGLKLKDELVKFYLKQEKYDVTRNTHSIFKFDFLNLFELFFYY